MKRTTLIIVLLIISLMTSMQIFGQQKKSKTKKTDNKEKVFITKANTSRITLFVHNEKYNEESFLIDFRVNATYVVVGYPKEKNRCITYSYPQSYLEACKIINNAAFKIKSKAKGDIYKSGELTQINCYSGKKVIFTIENNKQVKNFEGNMDIVIDKLIELAHGESEKHKRGKKDEKQNKYKDNPRKEPRVPYFDNTKE